MRWINHKDSFSLPPPPHPHHLLLASHSRLFPPQETKWRLKFCSPASEGSRWGWSLKASIRNCIDTVHLSPFPQKPIVPFLTFLTFSSNLDLCRIVCLSSLWPISRVELEVTSKTERTYEFLTLMKFFDRVFACREKQNVHCFVRCFGFAKEIVWPRYHRYSGKYKLFSWSQFCATNNSNRRYFKLF